MDCLTSVTDFDATTVCMSPLLEDLISNICKPLSSSKSSWIVILGTVPFRVVVGFPFPECSSVNSLSDLEFVSKDTVNSDVSGGR